MFTVLISALRTLPFFHCFFSLVPVYSQVTSFHACFLPGQRSQRRAWLTPLRRWSDRILMCVQLSLTSFLPALPWLVVIPALYSKILRCMYRKSKKVIHSGGSSHMGVEPWSPLKADRPYQLTAFSVGNMACSYRQSNPSGENRTQACVGFPDYKIYWPLILIKAFVLFCYFDDCLGTTSWLWPLLSTLFLILFLSQTTGSLLAPVAIAWSPEHVSCLLVRVGGMCAMYMSTCVCVYMYVCVCGNLRSSLVSSPDILHINFLDKVSF